MTDSQRSKFTKSVIKQFHNLVEVPTSMQRRISLLEDMEDLFDEDMFKYINDDNRVLGMKYLLGTWEIMIHDIKSLRTRDQYVVYRIITKICVRKEFYLETCGFDSDQCTVSPIFLPLLQRYSSLLTTTFLYCQQLLHDTISTVPVLFSSKIICVCYYRLPSIHRLFDHCLFNMHPSSILKESEMQQSCYLSFEDHFSTNQAIPKSQSLIQLSAFHGTTLSPDILDAHSERDADGVSERSVVTVDFSSDIIFSSSVPPTPSPTPVMTDFSPIPKELSPDIQPLDIISTDNQDIDQTIPGLRVKNYLKSIDHRIQFDHHRHHLTHSTLRMKLPSLFYWMRIVKETIKEGIESEIWWHERLSVCDSLLFDVIRSRFDLLDDYQRFAKTDFAYDSFPCYSLFLRCFVPAFQHAVLQKYNCGIQRRSDMVKANDYHSSGVKTSCYYLKDPKVANMLFEMIMSECNVYITADIATYCMYLDSWCPVLMRMKSEYMQQDDLCCLIEAIHHFIHTHPGEDEKALCQYLIQNEICYDSSDVQNSLEVLKEHDLLIISESSLQLQSYFDPFEKNETPLYTFHVSFPFFSFYSSLYAILHQEQLLVLKRGLLFIYNNNSFFVGNYRNYFYSHLFEEFPRLFSHWDGSVRQVFHYILVYGCLVSLLRDIPHFSSEQLMSLLDENQLQSSIQSQFGTSKHQREILTDFLSQYKKWKKTSINGKPKSSYRFTEDDHVCSVVKESVDNETVSIDMALASKIDSYLLIIINEFNCPETSKVPRHQRSYLLASIVEYIQLLSIYERSEKKVQSRKSIKLPAFDTAAILREPNQK